MNQRRIANTFLILRKQLINQKNHQAFSSKKYTPIMPLSGKFTQLYLDAKYKMALVPKPRSIFFWSIPSLALCIHNYLTQWTILNTSFAGLLFIAGLSLRFLQQIDISNLALSIEVNNDLKKIYVAVPNTRKTRRILKDNFNPFSLSHFLDQLPKVDYVPKFSFFMPLPSMNEKIVTAQQLESLKFQIRMLQKRVLVIELNPEKDIEQIIFKLKKEEYQQLETDKQRLTQSELLKKYQNKQILIKTNVPNYQNKDKSTVTSHNFFIRVKMQTNQQKKYQDYLLAWALGYDIKPQVVKQQVQKQKDNISKVKD